jgi:hypothetical protein
LCRRNPLLERLLTFLGTDIEAIPLNLSERYPTPVVDVCTPDYPVNNTRLGMTCALAYTRPAFSAAPFRLGAFIADNITGDVVKYTFGQNASYAHSVPLAVNAISNAVYRNTTSPQASIIAGNMPLPQTSYGLVCLVLLLLLPFSLLCTAVLQRNNIKNYNPGDIFCVAIPMACSLFMAAIAYVVAEVGPSRCIVKCLCVEGFTAHCAGRSAQGSTTPLWGASVGVLDFQLPVGLCPVPHSLRFAFHVHRCLFCFCSTLTRVVFQSSS